MADITVTAASVIKGSDAVINKDTVFGETITAGQAVYKKSDGKWWKAQCDGTAAEAGSGGIGVALNGGAADQPAAVQTGGTVTIGGTVVATTVYIVSATFGGICPVADIASSNYLTILGYGTTAAILMLAPLATGVTKA